MFYSLRKKINSRYFNVKTQNIRKKARIKIDPTSNFTLVTLLCDTDVNMYLLAVSSFCRFLLPKEIIVVSDRLSEESCNSLNACIENIKILPKEDFREEELPTGGCWERLICIIRHLSESYIIQLDADTLTLQRPDEVIEAINRGIGFTITTKIGFEKVSFAKASEMVADQKSKHVQNEAEKAFGRCIDAENRLYVRACAAFTGFAKESFPIEKVIKFSKEVEGIIGKEKWSEWGSEQVTSNYVVANSKDSILLPFDSYPYYSADVDENHVKLYHFIGSHRFNKGKYLSLSRQLIKSL